MNHATMSKVMDRLFEKIKEQRDAGQKEYAHTEDNVFANFDRTALELEIPRYKVMWVFMRKHVDGITAYIRGHKSQREHVLGRIHDLVVYLLLLAAAIIEEEEITEYTE